MSLYSVRIQENADQSNSEFGHFIRSVICKEETEIRFKECHDFHFLFKDTVLIQLAELMLTHFTKIYL